jgi:hypothetical protein
MSSFYRLFIQCDQQQKKKIDLILGKSNDSVEIGWSLIIEESHPKFPLSLDLFVELISNHFMELSDIGVTTDTITFWYMYEYEHQCNMEFWPDITKRIGDLGIVLCIICWEK